MIPEGNPRTLGAQKGWCAVNKSVLQLCRLITQRALHSVLSCCLCTACGTQFCMLCCQPEPIPRLLCARTSQLTSRSPCTPQACYRQLISTVCKTCMGLLALPPRSTPYTGVTVKEPSHMLCSSVASHKGFMHIPFHSPISPQPRMALTSKHNSCTSHFYFCIHSYPCGRGNSAISDA